MSRISFRLASSPHVRIHVGPEGEEKVYSLPKDLIAHYSPYFASCFKNNWKEGKEGILRLPEASTEFFDVLRDYFRCGQAEYNPECKKATEDLPPALVKCENARKKRRLLKCFQFIQFTNEYDVVEAASTVEKCLHYLLQRLRFTECMDVVGEDEVQFSLEILHSENTVLKLMARFFLRKLNGAERNYTEADRVIQAIGRLVQKNCTLAATMMWQMYPSVVHYGPAKPERPQSTKIEMWLLSVHEQGGLSPRSQD